MALNDRLVSVVQAIGADVKALFASLAGKAEASHTHTAAEISAQPADPDLAAIAALTGTSGLLKKTAADTWTLDTASYQPALVSGANIKTVNGQSVLGSGDLAISGGGGGGAAGFEQTFLLMGA